MKNMIMMSVLAMNVLGCISLENWDNLESRYGQYEGKVIEKGDDVYKGFVEQYKLCDFRFKEFLATHPAPDYILPHDSLLKLDFAWENPLRGGKLRSSGVKLDVPINPLIQAKINSRKIEKERKEAQRFELSSIATSKRVGATSSTTAPATPSYAPVRLKTLDDLKVTAEKERKERERFKKQIEEAKQRRILQEQEKKAQEEREKRAQKEKEDKEKFEREQKEKEILSLFKTMQENAHEKYQAAIRADKLGTCRPSKLRIYPYFGLNKRLVVVQSVDGDGGVLVRNGQTQYFIETEIEYVDGDKLADGFYLCTGRYKFINTQGGESTVFRFLKVKLDGEEKILKCFNDDEIEQTAKKIILNGILNM